MSPTGRLELRSSPQEPRDQLSVFLNRLVFIVNRCGHQRDDPNAEADLRVIGDFELIWFRAGVGRVTMGETVYECRRGSLLLIPPFRAHEIRTSPTDPHENYWIHFDVEPFYERERFAQLFSSLEPQTNPAHGDPRHSLLLLLGEAVDGRTRPGSFAVIAGLLRALSAQLFADAPTADATTLKVATADTRSILERAIVYARDHMAEELTIERLVEVAGCSRSRLFSIFADHFARPPMAVIRWMRVRQAEQLLRSTSLSVKEISSMVGVASQFHLSRMVKEQYGLSPRELRSSPYAVWTS